VLTLPPHGRASARLQDEVAGPNRKGSTELPTQPGDDNEIPVTIAILRAILVRLGRACHANAQRYQPDSSWCASYPALLEKHRLSYQLLRACATPFLALCY